MPYAARMLCCLQLVFQSYPSKGIEATLVLFVVGLLAVLNVSALSRLRDKSHGDYGL